MTDREALTRWAGTVLQLTGAIILVARTAPPPVAYVIMLLGSVIWAVVAAMRGDRALFTMMGAYTGINIVGLITWWQP